jgi:uncharacterized protein YoxC
LAEKGIIYTDLDRDAEAYDVLAKEVQTLKQSLKDQTEAKKAAFKTLAATYKRLKTEEKQKSAVLGAGKKADKAAKKAKKTK